ncbi:hypothetical protein K458DRAFT_418294 [Lentithecium fluviatile CBS 122367]|uniref:Uncharacterized protein n=1 Tax=Lentithecium fluviatile CBS 122367 TaxID=1168545 RepID=A0A6G1J178_9PLEO|nr:hypothetical protein K458DRAFT_418294 [Lentithecium fluviatile CBS 122367]
MDTLPLEILSMVMEQLWSDPTYSPSRGPRLTHPKAKSKDKLLTNLRSARLVCKAFCHAASSLFGEMYFQVIWVSLSHNSLSNLLALSGLPQFARHIHTLRIDAVKFDHGLHESGENMVMLAKALRNLETTLKSILLSLKCSRSSEDCLDETKVAGAVRNALLHSRVQPARLRVYTNRPEVFCLPNSQLHLAHAVNMQHLTCLKLDFLNATTVDPEIHQALSKGTIARFIDAIPQLQNLSIYFANDIWYRAPLNLLLGEGRIKSLKSIRLCGFNSRQNEMNDFMMRHKDTLQSLEIVDFKLRNGSWRDVFRVIHEQTNIETLQIRQVWDRDEVFLLSDSNHQVFARTELETVNWDSIATSRNDSNLDLEPMELGRTGTYVTFPEDLLYDEDDVEDDDLVNPLPYFAHELLHPGHHGSGGMYAGSDDGLSGSLTASVSSLETESVLGHGFEV